MRFGLSLVAGLPLALAASHAVPVSAVGREGEHYRIVEHSEGDHVTSEVVELVESIWPLALELYGDPTAEPEAPLELHLYGTIADYEDAEAKLTGGRFRENLSFSHWDSRTSHVALQPPAAEAVLDERGLPALTLRVLASSAACLASYAMIPAHRELPAWLADGSRSWLAQQGLEKAGLSSGLEEDPFTSTQIVRAQALLERDELPSAEEILSGADLDLDAPETFAVHGPFFTFLSEGSYASELADVLAEARRLGASDDYAKKLGELALEAFDSKSIDRDFRRSVERLAPAWDEVYRSLDTAGDSWLQVAFPSKNAIAWRTEPIGAADYKINGELTILAGTVPQLNVLLDRSDAGFVSVAFVAGGSVEVREYDSGSNRWQSLGEARVDGLAAGKTIAFEIDRKAKGDLQVDIDGEEILEIDVEHRDLQGPWGLGAQAGAAGVWTGVKVTPR